MELLKTVSTVRFKRESELLFWIKKVCKPIFVSIFVHALVFLISVVFLFNSIKQEVLSTNSAVNVIKVSIIDGSKESIKVPKLKDFPKLKQNDNRTGSIEKNENHNVVKKVQEKIDSSKFIKNDQGELIAISQNIADISYNLWHSIDPNYPLKAKRAGYNDDVLIKGRILVGLEGEILEIAILENTAHNNFKKVFELEVKKALSTWKFSPVLVDGKNIKIYFYKDFSFLNKI